MFKGANNWAISPRPRSQDPRHRSRAIYRFIGRVSFVTVSIIQAWFQVLTGALIAESSGMMDMITNLPASGPTDLFPHCKSLLKYSDTSDKSLDHFIKQANTVNYDRLLSFKAPRVCRRRKKYQRGSKHGASASGRLERHIPRFRGGKRTRSELRRWSDRMESNCYRVFPRRLFPAHWPLTQ